MALWTWLTIGYDEEQQEKVIAALSAAKIMFRPGVCTKSLVEVLPDDVAKARVIIERFKGNPPEEIVEEVNIGPRPFVEGSIDNHPVRACSSWLLDKLNQLKGVKGERHGDAVEDHQ